MRTAWVWVHNKWVRIVYFEPQSSDLELSLSHVSDTSMPSDQSLAYLQGVWHTIPGTGDTRLGKIDVAPTQVAPLVWRR